MKKLLHLLKHEHTLNNYSSSTELINFINNHNIDGFEIICCGEENSGKVPKDKIIGYHLGFFSYWIDMWNFNPKRLIKEFGDAKTCLEFYGIDFNSFNILFSNFDWHYSTSEDTINEIQNYIRTHIVSFFKSDCDNAKNMGAEYVVFHVSNVNIFETFTYKLENSDSTIINASIEIINLLLENSDYDFYFLLENLWWSGLNFLNPENSLHLLNSIRYEKKGFVLDVGHLLNTNINIKNESEAISYLNNIIDIHMSHFDLIKEIKAIHLHQSLSGEYVKKSLKNIPDIIINSDKIDFYEKFSFLYNHVLNIDTHQPMSFDGTLDLIERLNPDYLIFEITENNPQKLNLALKKQISIFKSQS